MKGLVCEFCLGMWSLCKAFRVLGFGVLRLRGFGVLGFKVLRLLDFEVFRFLGLVF